MFPNVKYELQEFEVLITVGGQPSDGGDDGITREKIKSEVERIKQTLVHEVFSFGDERHLERYIQYHQQSLIRLMDGIITKRHDENADKNKLDQSYQIYYNGLEDLLCFVERHFAKYFDQDAKAPEGYLSIARADVRTNNKKLQKMLAHRNGDPRIIDILLRVLKRILDSNSDQSKTYRKVMYAKEMQKELFSLLEGKPAHENMDEELRQLMYYLNYNSVKVITYYAHFITSLLDEAETRAEKIEKLSFELKKINQAQVKPGVRYNLHAQSLKDQLNNYITEEMDYQERLQHLSNNSADRPTDGFFQGFKLKFEASVSQLAYLIKILMECKIILNNNISQILHFLVRFATTKRSENISYGSLRSKYYDVEDNTKESVRNMLTGMIRYIDRS